MAETMPVCPAFRDTQAFPMTLPETPARHSVAITTSGKLERRGALAEAHDIAKSLGMPYVRRSRNAPLSSLLERADTVMVVRGDGIYLEDAEGGFRFSPGMAHVRIRRIDDGVEEQPDGILVAGDIREGDSVLDCTLGLAQDALVLARAVGTNGRVRGVEKSFPLYAMVKTGLERRHEYSPKSCRIETVNADAREYLKAQPDGSVDVVYFDPMFDRPQKAQPAFALLRRHAEHAPLDEEILRDAQRVARRWVVIKDAQRRTELTRLKLEPLPFRKTADLRFARLRGCQNPADTRAEGGEDRRLER